MNEIASDRKRRARRPIAALLALSLATAPLASALAGEADDRATARELAKEGISAEETGDCKTAIERLERAEKLFHAPVHLQHLARCYTKQGRLVEATEAWRKLTMETLEPGAPPVFKAAIEEAKIELPKVEPRLAHLTITINGSYPGLEVTLDDKNIPTAALGISRPTDPGAHVVKASASGYAPEERPVTLKESGSETVALELHPGGGVVVTSASASSSSSAPALAHGSDFPWRTAGLITAGVGGALLVGGVITGLSAKSKFNELDSDCKNKICPAGYDAEGKKSSIRTMTTLTNVFLVTGGILAVAGLGAFFLSPSPKSKDSVAIDFSPISGGGHVSLTGSF